MATRAIKKLTKQDDIKKLESALKTEDSDGEESEEVESSFAPLNKFNLLEENFDQADSNNEQESDTEPKIVLNTSSKNKKRKSTNVEDDDLTLETLNNLSLNTSKSENPFSNEKVRRLFQIESKNLNSDNEMIRMFGAKIVQAERNSTQGNQRGNRRPNRFKNNCIVNQKPTWPEFRKAGLSMRLLNDDESNDNTLEFTFEHSKEYQNVQFAFMDAVESLDHNNIINVLQLNPYHIDSLIQLSDVSRIHDDTQMAADLIERALFAFQNSFHPSFKFTSNTNQIFRLDYTRVENRGFFISLFKHLLYVGGKACYRTSLELCKLLLSLDIQGDPLGVILLIDFYAIRSSQYEYLVEFYETFNELKHLNLMPNMAMSVALAHYYLFKKTHNQESLEKANKLLQESLTRFPAILMELLDKCSVSPDKAVESHKIFAKTSHLKVPEGLKYLIDLYVTRMHYEWKIPENLEWLEKNVKDVIANEKKHENFINQYKNKNSNNSRRCKSLFSKVPPNLYRHLILSDLKEVAVHLPAEYSSTATYTFDPIPPKNSIISYTRPLRQQTQQGAGSTAESLLTFFQSLLPSFSAQNMNMNRREVGGEAEAAAAGRGEGAENNRFDFNQMVDRLRDFLANVEQNFPAMGNAENHQNDEDNDIDEFD